MYPGPRCIPSLFSDLAGWKGNGLKGRFPARPMSRPKTPWPGLGHRNSPRTQLTRGLAVLE